MAIKDIDAEAGEWLARLDRPEVPEPVRADFERWRAADPRHDAAYMRLAAAWQWLDRVQAMRPPQSSPDADFLRQRPVQRWLVVSGTPKLRWAVAAAIVVALIAAGWILAMSPQDKIYETSVGGFQRVVLSDGSLVELNTDSAVRVRYERLFRKLELVRGEANFKVARQPDRPFIVTAAGLAVRALGTQFNVRNFAGRVEVVVTEGKVAVGSSAAITRTDAAVSIVDAGQQAVASGRGIRLSTVLPQVSARKLAWKEGMLAFDGAPLAEAVAEFNRYNERKLVIHDPTVAAFKIGGYFRPANLEAFVRVLETNFGVRAETSGERIVLSAAGGGK